MLFKLPILFTMASALCIDSDPRPIHQSSLELQDAFHNTGLFKEAFEIMTSRDWLDCKLASGWAGWRKDGECTHLANARMDVRNIKEGCRLFIYQGKDCSGKEKQVYQGEMCVDINDYFSIKAFCG